MNYLQAITYIESLTPTLLDPSLARFAEFMRVHGNLQDSYPTVHVTGTNGKGSVVAMVDSGLRAAGIKTGRFTGPHLLRWNERFHVDGKQISDPEFADLASRIRQLSEDFGRKYPDYGALTWFEFLTAMAFFYFADQQVDCAVMEVGLGGLWDATNVIEKPLVCAITSIGLDHTHILGSSICEIAHEKAGIIKKDVPLVTACWGEALSEIIRMADERKAPVIVFEGASSIRTAGKHAYLFESETLDFLVETMKEEFPQAKSKLALYGTYQETNAILATAILSICQKSGYFNVSLVDVLAKGFAEVFWPGRFQHLRQFGVLLDGAHNEDGVLALREALDNTFPEGRRRFVLSFYENKNVDAMLKKLLRKEDVVYASQAEGRRPVCATEDIVKMAESIGCQAKAFPCLEQAFACVLAERASSELVIGTGSFATVKSALVHFGFKTVEESICENNPSSF